MWSSCVNELRDDILGVADHPAGHEHEELEPLDKFMVVSEGDTVSDSPDAKRLRFI